MATAKKATKSKLNGSTAVLAEALQGVFNEALDASEERTGARIDKAIEASEKRTGARIDKAIEASEKRMGKRIDDAVKASEERTHRLISTELGLVRKDIQKIGNKTRHL